jgi:gas vesicle protein
MLREGYMVSNSWKQGTAALLIGLGVGAGIALLFAPKSGKETREDIAGAVNDSVDSVVAQGKKMGRRAQDAFDQAQARVKDVAEAGERAYRESRTASS